MTITNHPPVTLTRDGDIIRAAVTVNGVARELGMLIDGQDRWIIDPWLNSGPEVFGITEIPVLDPAWLPTVEDARAIDAMPSLSYPPPDDDR